MLVEPSAPSNPVYDHRFPHRGMVPEANYFSLTWAISKEFGGVTTALLGRACAVAEEDR